jgi:hypothetical protein
VGEEKFRVRVLAFVIKKKEQRGNITGITKFPVLGDLLIHHHQSLGDIV